MTQEATNKDAARVAGQIDTPEERKAWYALRNPDNEVVATRLMTDSELKEASAGFSKNSYTRWELRHDQISIQYPSVDGPIEIRYDEGGNDWRFTLRGKDRSAQTLENAKAAIDAPVRENKRVFKKFEAFLRSGYSNDRGLERVTVTGLVGTRGFHSSGKAWIRNSHGRRDTAYINALMQMTPENEALVKQIDELIAQQSALSTQIKALSEKIAPVTITDADYD